MAKVKVYNLKRERVGEIDSRTTSSAPRSTKRSSTTS